MSIFFLSTYFVSYKELTVRAGSSETWAEERPEDELSFLVRCSLDIKPWTEATGTGLPSTPWWQVNRTCITERPAAKLGQGPHVQGTVLQETCAYGMYSSAGSPGMGTLLPGEPDKTIPRDAGSPSDVNWRNRKKKEGTWGLEGQAGYPGLLDRWEEKPGVGLKTMCHTGG